MKKNKCLRCGKESPKVLCKDCEKLEKCKLCGIVCRPEGKYKVYSYTPEERVEEINSFCTELHDGFCTGCRDWEQMIKNKCFICHVDFTNTYKNYKENGNCCASCNDKANLCLALKNVATVIE